MASQESDLARWRPLSVRLKGAEAEADYDALHEGVPVWLKASLVAWTRARLLNDRGRWDRNAFLRLERVQRFNLDWEDGTTSASQDLTDRLVADDELHLDVVDLQLRDLRYPEDKDILIRLLRMLHESGSAWDVRAVGDDGENGFALERRVAEPMVDAAEQAFRTPRAGNHLRRAWHAAYGRSANPSEAYLEAVRAVEAAARPVVTPKDTKATLGKMIVALRDAPAKWEVVLSGTAGQVETVSQMASLLWNGHTDRHGSDDPRTAAPITQEQAEAAVHLAVLLVQWFTSGSIRRLP